MKPEFDETYRSSPYDPLQEQSGTFDWDSVYAGLGEAGSRDDAERLALALRRLLQWMLQVDYNLTASPLMPDTLIGRRVVALAWVTNPDLFPDSPSLRQLSRQLGITAPILAALTGEVCREFGIQNRAQDHAWNRK